MARPSAFVASEGPEGKGKLLLIVAYDMGYSDLGCFGGEIKTPHMDARAKRGTRAANSSVAPGCSHSRPMLLSGTDGHVAGIGNMAELVARLAPRAKDWFVETFARRVK